MKEDTTYYEPFLRLSFLNRIHFIMDFLKYVYKKSPNGCKYLHKYITKNEILF